ncbi:DEAD/DEAH box helicase [Neobacillus drentensis]|uniref:helicase-related protein n=1 Tax=Neobacillus drentensis TaxID=220684 RepID=UPI001F39169A|nr:helicase-related protein [Neobacillus drentensis]ULT59597.1 DEAD/DEAH box helicase [Neobacillus drentensis]
MYDNHKGIIEEMLLGKISPKEARLQEQENKQNTPQESVTFRLISIYEKYLKQQVTLNDFMVIFRHYLLILKLKIKVSDKLFNEMFNYLQHFGLNYYKYDIDVEISCNPSFPEWLNAANEILDVYKYNSNPPQTAVGDGYLYNMTGYKEYTSKGQKYLVNAAIKQEEGTTIIAALRTGGGKSLVFQMPAFYDEAGVTIVIVPTVSLTIDQQQNIKSSYNEEKFAARVIHAGVTLEERKKIEAELKDGKVSLVYTSPEVVMRPWFKQVLFELAVTGQLNRFVIDEAHIVDEWGDLFRIDFQLLSVIRKKLLQLTNGRLKTLLVSATLSEETSTLLGELFSEKGRLIEIRTDTQREEIMYYYKYCDSIHQRSQNFEELLTKLPRPFIAYVGTKADAEYYTTLIRQNGFTRVREFTGDTSSEKREEILGKWKNDEIDIVVATSAFGVGVDKKDIRAVVHLYMPPSIDRFYQEVGRGGRDGYPALSISLINHLEDYKLVNNLTSNKVLTVEKIIEKITDLFSQPKSIESGDRIVVNTMISPRNRDEQYTGRTFANWYGYVLLFLYRNGFIDILDVEWLGNGDYDCVIQIKDFSIVNINDEFVEKIRIIRESERNRINKQIDLIKEMLKVSNKSCYGYHLEEIYPYATKACLSCPACRLKKRKSTVSTHHISVTEGRLMFLEQQKLYQIPSNTHVLNETLFQYDKHFNTIYIRDHKFNVILVENRNQIDFEYLPHEKFNIYEYDELLSGDDIILNGTICIVLSENSIKANKIYQYIHNLKSTFPRNKLLYIAKKNTFITSESRYINELIQGPVNEIIGDLHEHRN